MQGWFVPPATTNYRFYAACDDACRVYISETAMSTSSLTTLLDISEHSSNRELFNPNSGATRRSGWVALTQGEHYYIEGRHTEASGADHMSVSVEIERSDTAVHQNQFKEIQKVEVTTDQIFEKTKVYISGFNTTSANMTYPPDNMYYVLAFTHPDGKMNISDECKADATAAEFKSCVEGWYSAKYGTTI
jgi:hypothetical protein